MGGEEALEPSSKAPVPLLPGGWASSMWQAGVLRSSAGPRDRASSLLSCLGPAKAPNAHHPNPAPGTQPALPDQGVGTEKVSEVLERQGHRGSLASIHSLPSRGSASQANGFIRPEPSLGQGQNAHRRTERNLQQKHRLRHGGSGWTRGQRTAASSGSVGSRRN